MNAPNDHRNSKALSRNLSWLLDNCLKIPGTDKRIGLDPIIGLVPGAGDLLATLVGLTLLGVAAKEKVPNSVFVRMIGNWALNALVGIIPVLGDLFSFWFKSNLRNDKLLRAHLDGDSSAGRKGWTGVIVLSLLALAVLALMGALLWWLIGLIF
ncbi:MAG: DUF4112 domain-containing protein [Akkermansiaceae bacterium]|nr:DUF4112 domain-containing protein [Akkermansiaceae bacterium]